MVSNSYDKPFLIKCLMGFVATMLLMKATGGWGFVFIVPFALYSTLSKNVPMMLFWLLLSNGMLLGNVQLMPRDVVFAIAHKGMMILVGIILAVQISGCRTPRIMHGMLGMYLFLAYMLVPSTMGWAPLVSYLKLFLFSLVFTAYVGTAKYALQMPVGNLRRYRSIVLALVIFFVMGSLLLIPFPGISQMSGEEFLRNPRALSLFQGMTWNSQMLGPLVAAFEVILFCDLIFNIKRMDKLYVLLLLVGPYLVYKTSCRTGMAAMVCGMLLASFIFFRARNVSARWRNIVTNIVVLTLFGMLVLGAFVPKVRDGVMNFIVKYRDVSGERAVSTEEVMRSRNPLIESALFNWRRRPFFGNGFQVSDSMVGHSRQGILSYLTAPIEKGVWITAILEEGGILGMIIFVLFWSVAIFTLWRQRVYCAVTMMVFMIISNLAEFTIFAMSAEGGIIWALTFVGVIFDGLQRRDAHNACF